MLKINWVGIFVFCVFACIVLTIGSCTANSVLEAVAQGQEVFDGNATGE